MSKIQNRLFGRESSTAATLSGLAITGAVAFSAGCALEYDADPDASDIEQVEFTEGESADPPFGDALANEDGLFDDEVVAADYEFDAETVEEPAWEEEVGLAGLKYRGEVTVPLNWKLRKKYGCTQIQLFSSGKKARFRCVKSNGKTLYQVNVTHTNTKAYGLDHRLVMTGGGGFRVDFHHEKKGPKVDVYVKNPWSKKERQGKNHEIRNGMRAVMKRGYRPSPAAFGASDASFDRTKCASAVLEAGAVNLVGSIACVGSALTIETGIGAATAVGACGGWALEGSSKIGNMSVECRP